MFVLALVIFRTELSVVVFYFLESRLFFASDGLTISQFVSFFIYDFFKSAHKTYKFNIWVILTNILDMFYKTT